MNSFQFNKIFGAILATLLGVFALNEIGALVFDAHPPEEPGYYVEVAEETTLAAEDVEEVVEETPNFASAIPAASVSAGANVAKKCISCHNFEEGEGAKTGPPLYGVIGREAGEHPTFEGRYSTAMENFDQVWTYERVYAYLADPKGYLSGTAMNFAGLNKQQDRLNVIAYMRSLDPNAPPLPEAEEAPAGEETDPAR